MKAIALKTLLYDGKIYDADAEFEMDDVSFIVRSQRGEVKAAEGEVEEIEEIDGLPPLDEKPARKKK